MAQAIPMILMAAGTVVSSYGMVQQGSAAERQANEQAYLQRNNALQNSYDAAFNQSAAEAAAAENLQQVHYQRTRLMKDKRRLLASSTVQLQRQGLDVGAVSFQDVLKAQAVEANVKAGELVYSGAVKGQDLRAQSLGFQRRGKRAFAIGQYDSRMTISAGKSAKRSSRISAGANLASGLGQSVAAGYQTGYLGD